MKIALIDYGSGNLQSAYKALELSSKFNKKNKVFIATKSKDLLQADKIVLPGVGTFSDCMKGIKSISAGNYGGKLGPHHFHLREVMK